MMDDREAAPEGSEDAAGLAHHRRETEYKAAYERREAEYKAAHDRREAEIKAAHDKSETEYQATHDEGAQAEADEIKKAWRRD
jgi:hypothetical protein